MPVNNFDNVVLQNVEEGGYLVQLFILMYKMLVFQNREKDRENNMYVFKGKIAYTEKVERKIAMKNCKIEYHLKKWTIYLNSPYK